MRRVLLLRDLKNLKQRAKLALQRNVRKYVPDPRDNDLNEMSMSAETYSKTNVQHDGSVRIGIRPGQSVEEYMLERDRKWLRDQSLTLSDQVKQQGLSTTKDGLPFVALGKKEHDLTVEEANKTIVFPKTEDYEVDEELLLLRRQLQVENEAEYRKFVAESKRSDMAMMESQKRRVAHPSDPTYDPFKNMPGYRPQDSTALAQWLKRQRESGRSASGLSLQTKEGQERFYNEEKMSTQFHANPFGNRVERPRGLGSVTVVGYSPDSLFLDGKEVIGSCIVTEKGYFHWNVGSFEEINERTMSLLMHLYPVPDVIFIGTGRNLYFIDEELKIALHKRGSIVHCLTTPNACAHFGLQLSVSRRAALAIVNPVPTNSYGVECFGDFIENDMYSLSDTQLGIPPYRQYVPSMYKSTPAAEKYRHMQGTGIGPVYHQMSDGRLVRPGSSGTKLRPMLEPGEQVDWENLPSYYHWYPKEYLMDYVENTTLRENKGRAIGDAAERRLAQTMKGFEPIEREHVVQPTAMPWDSASIPITKFSHERDDKEILVNDPKTGRVIGMDRETYDRWKKMMEERRAGLPESDPVEYDQERYVTSKEGMVFDLTKIKYRPVYEGRWNPRRHTGRNSPIMV